MFTESSEEQKKFWENLGISLLKFTLNFVGKGLEPQKVYLLKAIQISDACQLFYDKCC